MKASELFFERPAELQATAPVETTGRARDEVRLLVSTDQGHHHAHFFYERAICWWLTAAR
jgi:hypothetical protein